MKSSHSTLLDNPLSLFAGAGIFTIFVYGPFFFMWQNTYVKVFLFRSWWIQSATTYLFGVGLFFLLSKYFHLRREATVTAIIDIEKLESITSESAQKELLRVPSGLRETIAYRRISELLKGYINGEEIIRLNEELSRRDNEQIDREHALLDSIRQLIPVLGFLGTVLGLAMGMIAFPENMAKAATVDNLRMTLRDFAASLSVAFETTVLALGYTIVIILLSTLMKERQSRLVSQVDRKARVMVSKFHSRHQSQNGQQNLGIGSDFEFILNGWLEKWTSVFNRSIEKLLLELRTSGK